MKITKGSRNNKGSRNVKGSRNKKGRVLGVEAPGWQGAKKAHTGGTQLMSNAASRDGSASKNGSYCCASPKRRTARRALTAAALAIVLAAAGCDWPWPMEGQYDQRRCDDSCTQCVDGECLDSTDAGTSLPKAEPLGKDIDILFVVDNSNEMETPQKALTNGFTYFIEGLRSAALNNKIPNVNIGVVSTDLGAANYSLPSCEVAGGDGGKLRASPTTGGCIPPSKAYIQHIDGVTNINNPSITDPVAQVKDAFNCIAALGTGGCSFEMPLEAARRAVDSRLNRNPGFVRRDAALVIIFIAAEDDCSAAKSQLFDPSQSQVNDPLGPLTSFRCFDFGITCDCSGGACKRTTTGTRTKCKPSGDWLYSVDEYDKFFRGLKSKAGHVLMFALSGPTDKVTVSMDGPNPVLDSSCRTQTTKAAPAIRLEALVSRFDSSEHFNPAKTNLCSVSFSSALHEIGKRISKRIVWPPK